MDFGEAFGVAPNGGAAYAKPRRAASQPGNESDSEYALHHFGNRASYDEDVRLAPYSYGEGPEGSISNHSHAYNPQQPGGYAQGR